MDEQKAPHWGVGLLTILFWLGVVWGLRQIPLMGFDREVVDEFARQSGGWDTEFWSVLPMSVGVLLLVRIGVALAATDDPARRRLVERVGLGVFLLLTLGQVVATIQVYESLRVGASLVVPAPDWENRLLTGATLFTAASVLWLAASRITATRLVHGTLLLVLVDGLPSTDSWWLFRQDFQAWVGVLVPRQALLGPALAVPAFLALLVVAWRRPVFPCRLTSGFTLYSPLDVVGLVLVAAAVLAVPLSFLVMCLGSHHHQALALTAGGLVAGVILAWRWDPLEIRPRASRAVLAGMVALPVLSAVNYFG